MTMSPPSSPNSELSVTFRRYLVIEAGSAAGQGRAASRPSSTCSTSSLGRSRPPGVEGPDGEGGPVGVVPRRNRSERVEAAEPAVVLGVELCDVVLVPYAEDEAGAVEFGVGVEVLDGPVVERMGAVYGGRGRPHFGSASAWPHNRDREMRSWGRHAAGDRLLGVFSSFGAGVVDVELATRLDAAARGLHAGRGPADARRATRAQ